MNGDQQRQANQQTHFVNCLLFCFLYFFFSSLTHTHINENCLFDLTGVCFPRNRFFFFFFLSPDEQHDVLGSPEDRPRLPQPPFTAPGSALAPFHFPLLAARGAQNCELSAPMGVELRSTRSPRARVISSIYDQRTMNKSLKKGKENVIKTVEKKKKLSPHWFHLSRFFHFQIKKYFDL